MKMRAAVVLALFAAGCGPSAGANSRAVGAQCTSDQDCNNRCITDDRFGGGMCTVSCTTDQDCPDGAACIGRDGNVCAVSCASDTECSDDFGRGWACKDEPHASGGDINVCRLP